MRLRSLVCTSVIALAISLYGCGSRSTNEFRVSKALQMYVGDYDCIGADEVLEIKANGSAKLHPIDEKKPGRNLSGNWTVQNGRVFLTLDSQSERIDSSFRYIERGYYSLLRTEPYSDATAFVKFDVDGFMDDQMEQGDDYRRP